MIKFNVSPADEAVNESSEEQPRIAEAATELLQRGMRPIPLDPGTKRPAMAGWVNSAITEAEIPFIFNNDLGNLGILLGTASGNLIDIDADCREAVLAAELLLPDTDMTFARPEAGRAHYFYIVDEAVATQSFKGPDSKMLVELRSKGSQTMVPPSRHPDGDRLAWKRFGKPAQVTANQLIAWCSEVAAVTALARAWPAEGSRQEAALAFSGWLLGVGYSSFEVRRLIEAVAIAAGDDELDKRVAAVTSTVNRLESRDVVTGRGRLSELLRDGAKVTGLVGKWLRFVTAVPAKTPVTVAEFNQTDLGNAERFLSEHADSIRYVANVGWYRWDGKRWERDDIQRVHGLAKQTVRKIAKEADEKASTWSKRSESKARIDAVVSLAETPIPGFPRIVIKADQLDSDQWLLNVNNGTVDLRTGELLPFDRSRLISKLAPVDYDRHATCPRWEQFLNDIFNENQDLISYVQRALGYCLTGSVSEQVVFFAYGLGANGKSTLLDVFRSIMGDYATAAAPDLLVVKKFESHPTELADLCGVRFLTTIEVDEGRQLAESLVKWISGGDRIKARRMRQDFFEFDPTHKIWIAANSRPVVKGGDFGIWRRLNEIPFEVKIEKPDPNFRSKLEAELPGILQWAIRGCLDWQQQRLNPPATIKEATEAYKAEMNLVGRFLEEECIVDLKDPNARVLAKNLYARYTRWSNDANEYMYGQRQFHAHLLTMGYEKRRADRSGKTVWLGISLKPELEPGYGQDVIDAW